MLSPLCLLRQMKCAQQSSEGEAGRRRKGRGEKGVLEAGGGRRVKTGERKGGKEYAKVMMGKKGRRRNVTVML